MNLKLIYLETLSNSEHSDIFCFKSIDKYGFHCGIKLDEMEVVIYFSITNENVNY